MPALLVGGFRSRPPRHRIDQARSLDWLAQAHATAEATLRGLDPAARAAFAERMRKVIGRCACGPGRIRGRASVLGDFDTTRWDDKTIYDLERHPHGRGTTERTTAFAAAVDEYFEAEYRDQEDPPADILHVTCTGYVAPSGAQRLVARRGWGAATRVTHVYHMGCYGALPALRIAASTRGRADIVHTELCTLHLDPADHSPEQLVVQSLFADGLIRYTMYRGGEREPALRLLAEDERILPECADSMQWLVADSGLRMTLGRDVPERIGAALRGFVVDLCERAGVVPGRGIYAVHPGGPKIIDRVAEVLELGPEQVAASVQVLLDHGNMSSATLPHIWMRLLADPAVAPGTPIVSLAFGPGLTLSGAVLRKQG